jgi:CRISPR-associated protein Csc1
MIITECKITLMENVLFVSTEFGNEYHAYGLIGNTALPYALGLCPSPYLQFKKPMHRDHFKVLREEGIYITPVTFKEPVEFKMERFNCIPESYEHAWNEPDKHGKVDNRRRENYPDEGIFKMIARGNTGTFYIISSEPVEVPSYIRVGKFMSKCKIDATTVKAEKKDGIIDAGITLRAEDIDPALKILEFQKIPVQHGMYLRNVRFEGPALSFTSPATGGDVNIPGGTCFYATEIGA